ncbi:16S rRNA processing protein RimM [Borrelia sp. A-FGy1]|uniref:ribosome maturation factor RimM n=1 Tax=Borrelia sp. A-FGy1 TaxID=2608247 RepID=UPI0015F583D5|nr:ribosome maturation factor RimM [Borrelia sp. A-FGy1]QMU99447.1 16S rRNA processing protein RimM [Borrelia sp. A-FGy1]
MFMKGVIMSSYGINGYAKVKSMSNDLNGFLSLKGNKLTLRKKCCSSIEVSVENIFLTKNILLLKFEEFNSPEAVKNLIGFELWVSDEFASKLEEDEYYFGELIGYSIVSSGEKLGVVISFLECGNSVLLEVKTCDKLFFIPFLEVYLGDINRELKTIELKMVELLR